MQFSISNFTFLIPMLVSLLLSPVAFGERPDPSRWEETILAFEAADEENPPPEEAILFIGSSSIRGWRTLAEDFPAYDVINRGFGGSIIADSTHFANRIVLPYKPAHIVFYAGENDLKAGLSPEQVAEDFKDFVALVHEHFPKTRIAFISMKPSPSRADLIDAMRAGNALIRDYTRATPRVEYIDVFEAMLDAEGAARKEIFVGDNLHLNADGYQLWKTIVGSYLERVVG